MTDSPATDRCLLSRAAAGDDPAFSVIVSRHLNMAYSAALRILGDSPSAEKAVTTAFRRLRLEAGSLDADCILATWIHAAVCSACRKRATSGRFERTLAGV